MAYLWQRYRDEKALKRIAANMAFSGKAILPEFGHLLPDEVTPARCKAHAVKRRKAGRQNGTIWTELNHLQIVLNWAKQQRIISSAIHIERPAKPPPKDIRITRQDAKRLRDAPDLPHVKLAVALLIATGARIGAILDLTWDRVNLTSGIVRLADSGDHAQRKGRATVPITEAAVLTLLSEARKGAISDYVIEWNGKKVTSIKRAFAAAVEKAGLSDVTPHVIRHSVASWMAGDGVDMEEIAQFLGHDDVATTRKIYARFSPTHLKKASLSVDLSGVPGGNDEPTAP